jgi:hypothetical protein
MFPLHLGQEAVLNNKRMQSCQYVSRTIGSLDVKKYLGI